MSIRQIVLRNETLREQLAAEYALGTLIGGARRHFEKWMHDDAALRFTVHAWQDRLNPLAEFAPAVTPPADVWRAIAKRIGGATSAQGKASYWLKLREDLSFWRGLGLASTALATILVMVLLTKQPDVVPAAPSFVAMLSNDQAQPIALVTGNPHKHELIVKVVAQQNVDANHSLEVWALPKEGPPRSLGLMASNGSITLALPENATPDTVPALAVTLEPKGGSPNAGPTGPVVFKGAWVRI